MQDDAGVRRRRTSAARLHLPADCGELQGELDGEEKDERGCDPELERN